MSIAWVFPGQGSQVVGMGQDLAEQSAAARAVFAEADDALGFALSELCFTGPAEALRQTINQQPAILVASIAALRAAQEAGHPLVAQPPAFVAGHSLGEYTALVAAGALAFADAVRLVRERGRLMHAAGEAEPSGMAAVLNLDEEALAEVCAATGVEMANLNAPGQIVISGAAADLERGMAEAKVRGARRVVPLNVSGAFHSRVMRPAADGLNAQLDAVTIQDPICPVVANVEARPLRTAAELRQELRAQLCRPVQWQRSVELMAGAGVDQFVEIGPGNVLSGMIRRIAAGSRVATIGRLAEVRET